MIRSLFSLFLLVILASHAHALPMNFAWDPVTKNSDGTPAVVDGYNLYRSTDGGASFLKLIVTGTGITTATDPNVPSGNVCYQVTAFNRAGQSAASNRLCFQVPSAGPSAPANLREVP